MLPIQPKKNSRFSLHLLSTPKFKFGFEHYFFMNFKLRTKSSLDRARRPYCSDRKKVSRRCALRPSTGMMVHIVWIAASRKIHNQQEFNFKLTRPRSAAEICAIKVHTKPLPFFFP